MLDGRGTLVTHARRGRGAVEGAWIDAAGALILVSGPSPGVVDDRDLLALSDWLGQTRQAGRGRHRRRIRREFSKSRPRRSNNNALVESRNAHVVRKHLSHEHVPVRFARESLSPLLDFHRPCLFAAERVDTERKVRRTCRREDVLTPLEMLKSLPDTARFLREDASCNALDHAAAAQTDMQAAKPLNHARDELFRAVHDAVPAAA